MLEGPSVSSTVTSAPACAAPPHTSARRPSPDHDHPLRPPSPARSPTTPPRGSALAPAGCRSSPADRRAAFNLLARRLLEHLVAALLKLPSTASTFCVASSTVRPGAERALAPSITLLPSPLSAGGGDPPRQADVARAQASAWTANREARIRRASVGTARDRTTRRNDSQRNLTGPAHGPQRPPRCPSRTPSATIGPSRSPHARNPPT